MRIDVLGVGFDNLTMTEAVERGMELVQRGQGRGERRGSGAAGRHRRHQGRGHAGDASEGKDAGR